MQCEHRSKSECLIRMKMKRVRGEKKKYHIKWMQTCRDPCDHLCRLAICTRVRGLWFSPSSLSFPLELMALVRYLDLCQIFLQVNTTK